MIRYTTDETIQKCSTGEMKNARRRSVSVMTLKSFISTFFSLCFSERRRKRFLWKAFLKLALFRLNLNSLRGIVQLTIDFSPPFSLYREMIWRVIESQSAYKRPDTFCPFRIKEKRQFCQPPNPNASESWL